MNKEQQASFLKTVGRFIADKFEKRLVAVEQRTVSIQFDGERRFTVKSGDSEQSFTLPTIIDRGVYDAGKGYEKGDAVSDGGSLWIAQKDAPNHKPGDGDGWRLAVKRGRDAK